MTIQEALKILSDNVRLAPGKRAEMYVEDWAPVNQALAIVEIMIAEPGFITFYQEWLVRKRLETQEEERE